MTVLHFGVTLSIRNSLISVVYACVLTPFCTVVMHDINLEVPASSFLYRPGACSDSFSFYESPVTGMDDAAD
jgi:hypothetical protein